MAMGWTASLQPRRMQRDEGQFDQPGWIFGGCGGAVAYRRAMLDQVGMFDESFFMYCEDVDLNWRSQLAGWKCWYTPEAVVYHKLSATGGGPLASYYTGRNTLWVLVKNYPGSLLRRYGTRIVRASGASVMTPCEPGVARQRGPDCGPDRRMLRLAPDDGQASADSSGAPGNG